jgi:hypothetical protein
MPARKRKPRPAPGLKAFTVSRQPQRTPLDRKESTSELTKVERVATALRGQFFARFRQVRADSAAYFRKEMAYWPSTKRLMRIEPRDKFWIVPDDSDKIRWMRVVFTRFLDALSAKLAQPRKIEEFIRDLRLMRPNDEWVEREARKIWPLVTKECLLWAQVACDGRAEGRGWRAPGWLDNWPANLPPKALLTAARRGRLDGDGTALVLKHIVEQVKAPMEEAQRNALNNVRIRFAQAAAYQAGNAAASRHANRRSRRPDSLKTMVGILKKKYSADASDIEHMCNHLDQNSIPLPPAWRRLGKSRWHETWSDSSFRGRVKKYISNIQPTKN